MSNWYYGYNCAAAYCETLEGTISKHCRTQTAMNKVIACLEPEGPLKQAKVQQSINFLSHALTHGWKTGAAVRKWVANNINSDWPLINEKERTMKKPVSEHLEQVCYFA